MRPTADLASDLGLAPDEWIGWGPDTAKITHAGVARARAAPPKAKLILVSAINPTPAGEGKTTTSIGLAQGLRRRKRRVALALREPSLGPVMGMKGGGTGGGKCRLEPSDRINLHFTGDLHAVTAAHNLLAALVDNAIQFGGTLDLEHRQVVWKRAIDMNDRFLRRIVIGLGGRAHGVPREDGFEITAASEVMAVLCLARDLPDLKERLGRIIVGYDRQGAPVTAGSLRAAGAMAALLYDAVLPNLVQSTEGVPALVHGGPFGNIAHGCNSIFATRSACALADYVVTEAGFGVDLGAEKFFDIKCRASGLWPSAVVVVATVRALQHHAGGGADDLSGGLENLYRHIESIRVFGFQPVIALNRHSADADADVAAVERFVRSHGLEFALFDGFARGGEGAEALAAAVEAAAERPSQGPKFLYTLEDSPEAKIEAVARTIYGARDVEFTRDAKRDLERVRSTGHANLPVCIAKTHLSLSDDPAARGRPRDFEITIRSVRAAAGAGYLLALAGDIVTMPGLPAKPAAHGLDLSADGQVTGIA